MILKNKYTVFTLSTSLSIILFVSFSINYAFAGISIVEVMYNPKGADPDREWVKISNDDESDIVISKLKITINGSNHIIKDLSGSTVINKGDSVVVVDNPDNFKINYPSYTGKLFDSSFTLTNESGSVDIKDDKNVLIDTMSYTASNGAFEDGNSLQKINGVWVASTPSIASPVETESTSTDNANNQSEDTIATSSIKTTVAPAIVRRVYISSHSGTEDLSDYQEKTAFEISAGRDRMALVGSPIEFKSKYTLLQKNQCIPEFNWTFGDGFGAIGKDISHNYKYPGEYQVILNGNCGEYNSVSRTIIKVVLPSVSIVGLSNGDTEISNNSKTEINIGNWIIKNGLENFVFPQDTIINGNNKIILAKEDLHMGSTTEKISLNSALNREVAFFKLNNVDHQNTNFVSKSAPNEKITLSSSSSISIAEAENLLRKYKETVAFSNQQISNPIKISQSATEKAINIDIVDDRIIQAATVLESTNPLPSKGFWANVIGIPVRGVKSLAHIFYDF